MYKIKRKILVTGIYLFSFVVSSANAQDKFDLVNYTTEDGGKIEAAFFDAGIGKVVIFAYGAIFDKESWYFLAEKFQDVGVSSLCVDFRGYGNSTANDLKQKKFDIIGAIQFLKEKDFTEINIVGASMGGAAVLSALTYTLPFPISKVVLLAPAGGHAIESKTMKKLFVVSKDEGLYHRVKSIFKESTEPKTLKEYEGNTHAQHLFKTDNANELTKLILDFIMD